MNPHADFFAVAAAVIPALAVTLLVEQKFLAPSSGHAPKTQAEHIEYRRMLLKVTAGLILTVIGETAARVTAAWSSW
jgi:hypothetical protein